MKQNLSEVFRYLRAIYRYKYLFIVVSLLVMTIVTVLSFTLPKMYRADSTVFIEKNVIDSLVKGIAVTPDINERVRVLKYALLSRDLLTKTLMEIEAPIFTKSEQEQQKYLSKMQERIDLRIKGKDLFIVSLVDKDPVFAQAFVNTLVSKYVEENIASQRDETYGANRFLSEQIAFFKGKLERAEDAIIEFRNKQGIYFSTDEKSDLQAIKQHLAQIEEISLSIDTQTAKKARLVEQLNSLKPTVDSIVSGSAEGGKLAALERRLEDLRLRYTDNYPEIVRLKAEITSLRTQHSKSQSQPSSAETSTMTSLNPLHQDVQEKLFEVDAELSSLKAKKSNLEKLVAKRQQELREVPANKKKLGILIEERNSQRTVYQNLLARMGQSEVSKQMEIGNKAATFRIVDPAVLPKVPVSPNMLKMMLLAIVGGLGCGIGLIFMLENFDGRVRDTSFVKELGLDLLAVVPNIVDEREVKRVWRRDMLLLSSSTLYFLCIVGFFTYDLLLRR